MIDPMCIYDQIPAGEPLTRGRLIAAIEKIKLICEADVSNSQTVARILAFTSELVQEWEQELADDRELVDATNSSDLKYRMWRQNND